jgi:hypothetical protein
MLTRTPNIGTSTPVPSTPGASGDYAFILQPGSPTAKAWTEFHPDAGCDVEGVAGQVTSLNGEAVSGLLVQLGGTLPGYGPVNRSTVTGTADEYGAGGYELIITRQLVSTSGTLWIQLMDQQKLPLSDMIYFNTYDDCKKNLIMISFNQIK